MCLMLSRLQSEYKTKTNSKQRLRTTLAAVNYSEERDTTTLTE